VWEGEADEKIKLRKGSEHGLRIAALWKVFQCSQKDAEKVAGKSPASNDAARDRTAVRKMDGAL
jgi:hypothetical protein